jgi:hypothetical protein
MQGGQVKKKEQIERCEDKRHLFHHRYYKRNKGAFIPRIGKHEQKMVTLLHNVFLVLTGAQSTHLT